MHPWRSKRKLPKTSQAQQREIQGASIVRMCWYCPENSDTAISWPLTRSSAHSILFPFISFFYFVSEIQNYIIWSLHHEYNPKFAYNTHLGTVNRAHTTAAINYCILTSCLATKKVDLDTKISFSYY